MNADLILAHFNRISGAPSAISRIRQFIFDLAVRGKLVEQSPDDEPALELLANLEARRLLMIKRGELRDKQTSDRYNQNEDPFSIPTSWRWCVLSQIGAIVGGGTPPSSDANNFAQGGSEIPWLTPADLGKYSGVYISHGSRDLTPKGLRSSSATMIPKGSVLFTSRAPIGYTAIAANDLCTNQGFKSVVPFIEECNLFIRVYFRAFAKWIESRASGTTFREVSGKIVAGFPFPLPPLAEQIRIVAKLDELMALCNRLEDTQRDRQRRRDRLTASAHHYLNNEDDAGSIRDHAKFFINHLPRFTDHPDQLKQLRDTIRSLAIMGKLTSHDLSEEPASVLLSRIELTRTRLLKERRIPRPHPIPEIEANDIPFASPLGWEWVRLGMVCYQVSDGPHFSPQYVSSAAGVPFLSARNVKVNRFDLSDVKYVSAIDHQTFSKRVKPELGDVLYTKGGTTGVARVNDLAFEFSVWVHVAVLKVAKEFIFPEYLALALNSPFCYEQSQHYTQGTSNFDLGLTRMIKILFPLPPYVEQQRIVAGVNKLMSLCDQLEEYLTNAHAKASRLLESLLHHALLANEPQLRLNAAPPIGAQISQAVGVSR